MKVPAMLQTIVNNSSNQAARKPLPEVTKCLLVDDHPIVLTALKGVLLRSFPEIEVVGTARNRAQALEMMPREGGCLVVTDLSLPDSEGLDLIHELLDRCPSAQILVFSMHDETKFGPRALEAGAHGYLTKGDNINELTEALACVLEGDVYASPRLAQLLMRRSVGQPHAGATVDKLTEREFQVFKLIGEAYSTKEIASMLHLSPKTIETHRDKIKTKLGLTSGGQLLIAARDFLTDGSQATSD